MRILLVEDDKKINGFISKGLREAGFIVDVSEDGNDAQVKWASVNYDLVITDIMLPGQDGFSLIESFRSSGDNTPVIILSAKRDVDDRIRGLQAGGDDYMTKPFSFSELLARVNALLRRINIVESSESSRLSVGDITIDLYKHSCERADETIYLQPKEFALLEYLMRNAGRVISKTLILERVYEYDFDPQTNVVDVLVCRLRNKIDKDYDFKYIKTIRGVGYVFRTE